MAAWDLSVTVEGLGPAAPPIQISVTSDLHIGGVILKIVEATSVYTIIIMQMLTINTIHSCSDAGNKSKLLRIVISCVDLLDLQQDWSDHALWWEQKQQWLLRTNWTLDKCGILADARLFFSPQHKPLRIGLPNGVTLRLRACFSSPVFRTVLGICKILSKILNTVIYTY